MFLYDVAYSATSTVQNITKNLETTKNLSLWETKTRAINFMY